MPESARIVVRRPPGGARDLLRKYRIEVDGEPAGTVARGGTTELTVPPGPHHVRATIDWAGSGTLRVDLGPGEVAHLRVEPGGSVVRVDQMLSRTGYLRLSAEEAAGGTPAPDTDAPPRLSRIALVAAPFAFLGIFLVSYGVHGLLGHDRAHSWAAVLGGVALYVVPLLVARRARRRRTEGGAP